MSAQLQWAREVPDRQPWGRIAGVGVLVWWTLWAARSEWIFLDFVNLAFHEAGHIFFRPLGSTMMYLGGTLGQLLVPLLLAGYFLLGQQRPLGSAFCLWWAGQNLANISVYMADARSLALPLVGGGDHDWNELFYRFGLLAEPSVRRVAAATWGLGVLVMIVGLAWCAFFALRPGLRERLRDALTRRQPRLAPFLDDA
jgi:hypothetical protein